MVSSTTNRGGWAGLDEVEFLLAAGPEEPLRPLGSTASGGEASRIMLALKAAAAEARSQAPAQSPSAPASRVRLLQGRMSGQAPSGFL